MRDAVVTAQNVSCCRDEGNVLQDVSFAVPRGDYLGIVGPNGSGKSTLIRTLLGLYPHAEGEVRLFGTELRSFTDWHRIGYLPQSLRGGMNAAFPATVKEIVRLGLLSRKKFPKRLGGIDRVAVANALECMGIADIGEKMIGELSGGQQQRVLLARALVNEPELLIMDEPTTALDPDTRERFFDILDELNKRKNTTIILVTHDTGTIGRHAKTLLYLDKKVVFHGTFDDFCGSEEMTGFFGPFSQHIICHRH